MPTAIKNLRKVPLRMSAEIPSPKELGRRLRAARTYCGVDQIPLAKKLRISPDTLGRYENGKTLESEIKRTGLIDRSAKALKLPQEFFVVDFGELPQMTETWRQAKRLRRPEDLERIVDDALGQEQQPE